MPDFTFDRHEIESLARKLDSLRSQLSEDERRLLLAVFSSARVHVSLRAPTERSDNEEPTLAELEQQILNAFIPGHGFEMVSEIRIGGDPIGKKSPSSAEPPLDPTTSDEPPEQP